MDEAASGRITHLDHGHGVAHRQQRGLELGLQLGHVPEKTRQAQPAQPGETAAVRQYFKFSQPLHF